MHEDDARSSRVTATCFSAKLDLFQLPFLGRVVSNNFAALAQMLHFGHAYAGLIIS